MRCVVLLLITIQCMICSAIIQHSAYHPVFEYDVPVASQPIVYAAPPHAVQTANPYYGSYAVHTTPAVSHTYSQTQTHPVAYIKPVTVFEAASGQYYAPSTATSRVEQSRLIVPLTNRIYRYQSTNQQYANPLPNEAQYRNNGETQNFQGEGRTYQQTYSTPAQYNENQNNGQNGRKVYANQMPYTNNGEQVKLRRYRVHRPGIKKEFYDVEERVIIRPAGSAVIELDPPTKKQDITEYQPNGRNYATNQNQYNAQGFRPNSQPNTFSGYNQNGPYFSTAAPDCGYGYVAETPVYEYSPPASSFDNNNNQGTQYHPTTFAPATTTAATSENYPTTGYPTTVPSQTYLPPYSTEQSFTSSSETYSSTPGQYTPVTSSFASSTDSSRTPLQQSSDIYISSTTPVSVTIIDKNSDSNQNLTGSRGQDIIYANQAQSDENSPDQSLQNEIPPRGDISQYRSDQPDQFYHELPRSRYTNEPDRPIVYSRSRGEPSTETPLFVVGEVEEVIEIQPKNQNNSTNNNNNQNRTSFGNNQQARLIRLYTENGGVSEVGQTEDRASSRYTNNENAQYQDLGNVRARVVSVTPPPATAIPTETVNRRRIVVSKPVTTVQEVVEAENSTQNANLRSKVENQGTYDDNNANDAYQSNFNNDNNNYGSNANYRNENNYNQNYNSEFNGNYQNSEENENYNANKNNNFNSGSQTTKANLKASSSNGVHISTTPSTASQRIIYVQPVSQDFAQQRAVTPKNHKN